MVQSAREEGGAGMVQSAREEGGAGMVQSGREVVWLCQTYLARGESGYQICSGGMWNW